MRWIHISISEWEKDPKKEPSGYIDWFEWAAWMHKSGHRQKICSCCQKWLYPEQIKDHLRNLK